MITIRVVQTPANVQKLASGGIFEAIAEKMTELMFRVQSDIVGNEIPAFFPHGAPNIASTVRAIPATIEGNKVVGAVEAGGPRTTKITLKSGAEVDYAAVQHEGISHEYEILPFTKKVLAFSLSGPTQLNLFYAASNYMFVRKVMHPAMEPRPYMTAALETMREQIIGELSETFTEIMK